MKGKLPKANYKKVESIDDSEMNYEREVNDQKIIKPSINRIVSAGPRRPDAYSNNLARNVVLINQNNNQ